MISIITPTYNRKVMLEQMIESILNQSYQNFEVIIVDDNSSDGTDMLMQKYENDSRIRYFRNQKNMGPGYNRNFGYKQAKGKYAIFIDDDDYYIDFDFFAKAIEVYKSNKDYKLAFVAANAYDEYVESQRREKEYIGVEGKVEGIHFLLNIERKYHKPLSTFPTVFNMEVLQEADFDNMRMVNDYAIYIRALLYGNVYILPDFVGIYRKHESNISLNIKRDFLIENLEERKWVKDRLKNRANHGEIQTWWNIQMRILFTYYIAKSKPTREDAMAITKWIIFNSGFSPRLWLMLVVRYVKIKIKAILGIS